MWSHTACDDLFRQARTGDIADGLVALGTFVTGRASFVAQDSIALRRAGDDATPLVDGEGNSLTMTGKLPADVVLEALGVEVIETRGGPTARLNRRLQIGGLVWRAGLLVRMLDTAFAHLYGRESNGQKTLQHQLVKSTFTECYALAERVRLEAPHGLLGPLYLDVEGLHAELGRATTKAAKLMGGHGFLRGGLNSLECLSLCTAAMFASTISAEALAAASTATPVQSADAVPAPAKSRDSPCSIHARSH